MLRESPKWTYEGEGPLVEWYCGAHLLPGRVLGKWASLDRESGRLDWRRRYRRPRYVAGVDSGVVVASDRDHHGCYGISLDDGRLLWTSHGSGVWRQLFRGLDFIPCFENEFRDSASHVVDGKVYCCSGRVLDVRSGNELPRESDESWKAAKPPKSLAQRFYHSGCVSDPHVYIDLEGGLLLSRPLSEFRELLIQAEDPGGKLLWRTSLGQTPNFGRPEPPRESVAAGRRRCIDGNYFSYRLMAPYIYFISTDGNFWEAPPVPEQCVTSTPVRAWLATLDIQTGEWIQELPLGDDRWIDCQIDDVDDEGLLVRGRLQQNPTVARLYYFQRRAKSPVKGTASPTEDG